MRAPTTTRAACRPASPKTATAGEVGGDQAEIAAFDPALIARDAKEEARVGKLDQRYNHWIAVRDGLMNAHAELFAQIPAIVKILPDPIDQMKFFELIQIIPTPDASGAQIGQLRRLPDFRREDHGLSAQQLHVHLRKNDRAKTSATFREILDAMWLFNDKFERALAKFAAIKAGEKS